MESFTALHDLCLCYIRRTDQESYDAMQDTQTQTGSPIGKPADQFRNYAHRGEVFTDAVNALD